MVKSKTRRKNKVKFGTFGYEKQLEQIGAAGFDTAELDISEIVLMEKPEFSLLERRAERSGMSFDVFSGLLPLSVRIHAPDFDEAYWLHHIEVAAERARALGATTIPFGAGKCRSIPEGCEDVPAAKRRVRDFVRKICDIFEKIGLLLVLEPLGPANSNYLNFIGEAVEFIPEVDRPSFHTMCDLRHMVKLNESFEDIVTYRSEILHAHIDYPGGTLRKFPQAEDDYNYMPYFEALAAANYQRILTIEATFYENFEEESAKSLEYIKKCWKNVEN